MKVQFQDKSTWHKWFAWHPVWINNTLTWLEDVQRRWIPNASSIGDFSGHSLEVPGWEYRGADVKDLVCQARLEGGSWLILLLTL